jgi:hypothetical protein
MLTGSRRITTSSGTAEWLIADCVAVAVGAMTFKV